VSGDGKVHAPFSPAQVESLNAYTGRACRKCGIPLVPGQNCYPGQIVRCDYICRTCYREYQNPYQREYRRVHGRARKVRALRPPLVMRGERFTRWLVLEDARVSTDFALCRCDCGAEKRIRAAVLRKGQSRSCGCLRRENAGTFFKTHGLSGHPLYGTWMNMVKRCTDSAHHQFADYGGRGIRVCDRWTGSEGCANFISDMGGSRPDGMSLDRIDNDGDYEPGNCRWATKVQQAANSRRKIRNAEFNALLAEVERLRALVGAS